MSHAGKSFSAVSDRRGTLTTQGVLNIAGPSAERWPVNVNVMLAVRVLNTCLYLGFRADVADREEDKAS
jgi:hypothetical protein